MPTRAQPSPNAWSAPGSQPSSCCRSRWITGDKSDVAQCPAEAQARSRLRSARPYAGWPGAELARLVRATERHGDDEPVRTREDVCAPGERILEDRASLVGVRLGFGPATGPPFHVAQRAT